jgi:RNA polymerase sigma-70 factor (ECF subfamily)
VSETAPPAFEADPGMQLLGLYDVALPQVYGYLLPRCGNRSLAEDLTAESFLAAVAAVRKPEAPPLSIPWLIGVARHKLVDHWRRQEREQRHLEVYVRAEEVADETVFEPGRAAAVLAELNPMQRAALTLRYVDDLPVPEVARVLGRTVHATETLLVRAKRAFRSRYADHEESDHG